MGYSAESRTVLGFYVSDEQAIKKETTRGCKCKLTEQELKQNFCPHCGKQVTIIKTINVGNELEEDLENDDTFEVYDINADAEDFYVGVEISTMCLKELESLDFKRMANNLATKLQMHGLSMDIDKFGIHNFLYESY